MVRNKGRSVLCVETVYAVFYETACCGSHLFRCADIDVLQPCGNDTEYTVDDEACNEHSFIFCCFSGKISIYDLQSLGVDYVTEFFLEAYVSVAA